MDVVVDAYQFVSTNSFTCPKCCGKRKMDKAKVANARLLQKAEVAREEQKQMPLPGM